MIESFDFLAGGGRMGELMRAHDWRATALGTPDTWPQSLRTSVSTCLNCSFPVLIWWGPDLVKLYNDAYTPILGVKHPTALGARGRDVWPEIWDIIGPMLDRVVTEGVASPADDLLLMLERHGFAEECYFSFSYSPIRDETEGVGGVFCPVIETTSRVVGERRLRLQQRLAEKTADLGSLEEVFHSAALSFTEEDRCDFPFVAFYRAKETCAEIVSSMGWDDGRGLAPGVLSFDLADENPWPALGAVGPSGILVPISGSGIADLPLGPWDSPPEHAVILPLGGGPAPAGYMLAGLNPCRPLDEVRELLGLVGGQISTAAINARAAEAERRRSEELAELDRVKTAFFANVSHEFRTPLTLLLGPLEDVIAGLPAELSGTMRGELELARRNALRLQKLVNSLLDFSRVEAGRAQALYQPTDLASATRDLASSFRSICEKAGLYLAIDAPPLPDAVFVDAEMWEKIVLNLVSNAFKFTLDGGIKISVRAESGAAVLRIEDTGTGIADGELPLIFDRFHRIEDSGGRSHEGTGIGLALVRELVKLHGGSIEVQSVVGQGSVFIVRLPFGSDHLEQARIGQPGAARTTTRADVFANEALGWLTHDEVDPRDSGAAGAARTQSVTKSTELDLEDIGVSKGHRILLADDNADMRTYIRRLLTERGYDVHCVENGESALAAVSEQLPDLVLSDVMMPRLDGFGLLQALRGDERTRELPVILLSARAGDDSKVEGLDAGADDYLVKPFSTRELFARVGSTIALAESRRHTALAVRDEGQRLRRLFEQAPGFICTLSGPDHVFDFLNDEHRRLFGDRDSLGKTIREAFPDIAGQGFYELLDQVYRTGERHVARAMPIRLQIPSDSFDESLFVDFIYAPVMDATDKVIGVFCEGHDVTATHAAQEALRQSEETLRQLNESLENRVVKRTAELLEAQAALRQAQKLEAMGQLTGGVAHDFNNLLSPIIGGLDILSRRGLGGEREKRLIDGALQSAERAKTLVQRLLAFARRQPLQSSAVDVGSLVTGMAGLIASTSGPQMRLEVVIEENLPPAEADPNQLEMALLNLSVNARDAMPNGGVLTISAESELVGDGHCSKLEPGAYIRLSVADTGMGMDEATLAKAIEPFFSTKGLGKGTGLGLSMVHGLVSQLGGGMAITSKLGEGATIKLWLPVSANSVAAVIRAATTAQGSKPLGTCLLVDDEDLVRASTADMLSDLGYTVVEAATAAEALNLLNSHPQFDLLVTDHLMPGLTGAELAKEVRAKWPGTPVLIISGYANADGIGPDLPRLIKPFREADLAIALVAASAKRQ